MTKAVRVENADAGRDFKLVLEVWDKSPTPGDLNTLVKIVALDHPTSLAAETITSTRYLIVREEKA
jgi:hypothetical protein